MTRDRCGLLNEIFGSCAALLFDEAVWSQRCLTCSPGAILFRFNDLI
jgi:hypothetical protein